MLLFFSKAVNFTIIKSFKSSGESFSFTRKSNNLRKKYRLFRKKCYFLPRDAFGFLKTENFAKNFVNFIEND